MHSARLERILITNDDGIDAPGLEALEAVAHELADEVWVVHRTMTKAASPRPSAFTTRCASPSAVNGGFRFPGRLPTVSRWRCSS